MSVLEPTVHRFTRDEYYRMADAGLFDGRRVELIEGEIIDMAPQKDAHAAAVRLADYTLRKVFGDGFTVQVQLPLDLDDSQPEPDLAVLPGSPRDHLTHPATALLVVEISDTTVAYDRDTKSSLYARAAISEYWLLDLTTRRLEVRRDPAPAGYTSVQILDSAATISPLAAPQAQVRIGDLLP